MKYKTTKPNLILEDIEKSLMVSFPDVKIFYRKSLMGRYLVLQKTKIVGMGILLKGEQITVYELIPSRAMMGLVASFGLLGLAIVKLSSRKLWKQFNEEVNSHISKTFC